MLNTTAYYNTAATKFAGRCLNASVTNPMSNSQTGSSDGVNPAKVNFVAVNVLDKGSLYLIGTVEHDGLVSRRIGYCTFDDPTGGAPEDRADIEAGETPGPVRTLLAFTSHDKAEEYIQEELMGLGKVYQIRTNTHDLGRMLRFMLGGKIYWFMFDRTPGSHLIQDRGTCWLIPLKLFVGMTGKYLEVLAKHKKLQWTPGDSIVKPIDDEVIKKIKDN